MEEGSIQETLEILKRWCARPGRALARASWESAVARERVIDGLRAALRGEEVPFAEVELPSGKSSYEVAEDLLQRLRSIPAGAVSITGIEWAYPEGGSLNETLGALSWYREEIAALPLRQVWWMPESVTEKVVQAIPDFNSWFRLRLYLKEIVKLDRAGKDRLLSEGPLIEVAEARRLADQLAWRIQNAEAKGVPDERIWRELGKPLLEILEQGGLQGEKELWLSRFGGYRPRLEARVEALRKERGVKDEETLSAIEELAYLAFEQGDFAAAVRLWSQVVEARRETLGPDHRETARAMGNLANLLYLEDNLAGARELQEQVLRSFEKTLDPSDLHLLIARNNLSLTLARQGDLAGAKQMQEQNLAEARRALGERDSLALRVALGLAGTLRDLGDLAGAKRLLEEAVEGLGRELGPNHPQTLESSLHLAWVLARLGELARARVLQEEILGISRRLMGAKHPLTVKAADYLLITLLKENAPDKARAVFHQDLEWLIAADPATLPERLASVRQVLEKLLPLLNVVEARP